MALDAVAENESLQNELLIYLAQTETTLLYDTDLSEEDINKINKKWESFE